MMLDIIGITVRNAVVFRCVMAISRKPRLLNEIHLVYLSNVDEDDDLFRLARKVPRSATF